MNFVTLTLKQPFSLLALDITPLCLAIKCFFCGVEIAINLFVILVLSYLSLICFWLFEELIFLFLISLTKTDRHNHLLLSHPIQLNWFIFWELRFIVPISNFPESKFIEFFRTIFLMLFCQVSFSQFTLITLSIQCSNFSFTNLKNQVFFKAPFNPKAAQSDSEFFKCNIQLGLSYPLTQSIYWSTWYYFLYSFVAGTAKYTLLVGNS